MRPALVLVGLLGACGGDEPAPGAQHEQALGTLEVRVFDESASAFSLPIPALDAQHMARFFVGNSFFNQNWVSAPASVPSRDGLGPLFNARSCSGCHFRDGRGRPPDDARAGQGYLVRLSIPGGDAHGGPRADARYGTQLEDHALPGVQPEARVSVSYRELPGTFGDGSPYSLRAPHVSFSDWSHGAPDPALLHSARVAPAMIGLGLLEAIPEHTLLARVDPDDRDGDGISGRVNRVWDVAAGALRIGRFGWKAEQPSVKQQVAGAFSGDHGLTTSLFPEPNHTALQHELDTLPNGGAPEVDEPVLDAVSEYARSLAVPAPRTTNAPASARGERTFTRIGCARCHVPTAQAAPTLGLGALDIRPYTDLLLHDMGEGLADGRPVFDADGREWRTPPLWGLGLVRVVNGHSTLLHDGRARDANEAVLWHGGEAERSKEAYLALSRPERAELLTFLENL